MSDAQAIPLAARKGRGAVSDRDGRFEPHAREAVDDGWERDDDDPPKLATTVSFDTSRTVIAYNESPDVGFDRSINPYRGCEHGCVYCYARPTHAYLGLSPGLDFESRLFAKPNAADILKRELRNPRYTPAMIALGTNTDPYQPLERRLRITRSLLEVLSECDHPVGIVTKSALVVRDLDILAPMAAKGLASVALSVTTLDASLASRMEPRAATPSRRLAALQQVAAAGVPTMVMAAPMIPAINDHELEAILERAAAAGAKSASYILVRLPLEIKDLFHEWLQAHFPDRAARVENLIRGARGGRLYDARYRTRMRGTGQYAELLARRFRIAARRLGLDRKLPPLDTSLFRKPTRKGEQLSLL